MRTRNAARAKPSPPVKQTPPAKKTPQKSPAALSPEPSAATPNSSGTKRTRAIQAKNKEILDIPTPQPPPVVEEKTSADDVTPDKKPVSVKKVTRVVKRKVVKKKTPASAKSSSVETSKQGDPRKEESLKEEDEEIKDVKNEESVRDTEVPPVNLEEPEKDELPAELVEEEDTQEPSNGGTRMVRRKVVQKKTPISAKCSSLETSKPGDTGKEESSKEEEKEVKDAENDESVKDKEVTLANVEELEENEPSTELIEEAPVKETEDMSNRGSDNYNDVIHVNADQCKLTDITVEHVEGTITKEDTVIHDHDGTNIEGVAGEPNLSVTDIGTCPIQENYVAKDAVISSPLDLTVMEEVNTLKSRVGKEEAEAKELSERIETVEERIDVTTDIVHIEKTKLVKEDEVSEQADVEHKDEVMEEAEIVEDRMDTTTELVNMEKSTTEALKEDEAPEQSDVEHGDEKTEEQGGEAIPKEFNEEGLVQDNATQHVEEVQRSEDEHAQLNALAEERKRKKEVEIFVGGLDRDAVDEDVKKAFEHIGDVVEIRVHKDPSNSKNKGYAFVKFGTKEQATRALAEVKHPVINGKRCGTAPCEDNDTLFLGNICNTWTKEAIRQKLKDYGIDGVESITLVPDPKHEGLSRGFSFIEFSCHGDAMLAYKRLQKPDVIFGHLERTAKVAFAEPLREPDPEVMSQVKSVFVDGLPPQWDEDHVRKEFKGYGDIVQVTLARNMSTSKRKDFGFVDFSTHEAAVACIDDINSRGLGDGNTKAKVKARLSNPLPKTQAVKGEMCGGFRIGRVSSGTPPQPARGAGRGALPFNRINYQRGRGTYHHGRGHSGRMGFFNDHEFTEPFRGRQNFGQGGRWGSSRGAHAIPGRGTIPGRFNLDRPSHGPLDRGHERHMPLRGQPFPPENFNRPFPERHYDDPYLYGDRAHGFKRPLYTDQDPRYMEPSRVRPRLDYPNPAFPYHGSHHRDASGSGSNMYPHDYRGPNGPNYGGDIRPSFFGGDRPYRGGYHY